MKHAIFRSLSESRSYQPPHPLCSRHLALHATRGAVGTAQEGTRFWLPQLHGSRRWLQPLCFFHLHECNSRWLSSSAQCTSSGKVSSLSHRQSGQSAWHGGGRAERRRLTAELSLAQKWQRGDKGQGTVTTCETNKQTKKRATETHLHGSRQAADGSSFWENKPGREEAMVWSHSVSVWVGVRSRFEWAHTASQRMSTSLPLFSHSAVQRSRAQLSGHHRVSEPLLFKCLTSPQRLTRSVTVSFFTESNSGALLSSSDSGTLAPAAQGLSAVCSVGSWRAGCCSPTESGLTVFTALQAIHTHTRTLSLNVCVNESKRLLLEGARGWGGITDKLNWGERCGGVELCNMQLQIRVWNIWHMAGCVFTPVRSQCHR